MLTLKISQQLEIRYWFFHKAVEVGKKMSEDVIRRLRIGLWLQYCFCVARNFGPSFLNYTTSATSWLCHRMDCGMNYIKSSSVSSRILLTYGFFSYVE